VRIAVRRVRPIGALLTLAAEIVGRASFISTAEIGAQRRNSAERHR
jgi:hypothetical protein